MAEMPKPLIVVVGSLNMDLTTITMRVPNGGETLRASSFFTGCGGKGANQAVACARLSRRKSDPRGGTAIIQLTGAVGRDIYGKTLIEELQSSGVDTTNVKQVETETGVAIILVEESTGQNRILINAGANKTVTPPQFSTESHLRPSLIILQLEIPLETTVEILRIAREQGLKVVMNPAPAVELPKEAYKDLAHLILNETEAAILSNYSLVDLNNDTMLPAVAADFHAKGVDNVIITLGHRGAFFSSSSCQTNGLITAEKVQVKDSTAAGDTFVGAYALKAISRDFAIADATRTANKAAAISVGRHGAQQSIPWLDELS